MTRFNQVHILCQELIPIYNELDEDARQVIENHTGECEVCKEEFNTVRDIDITPQETRLESDNEIKPFKKLFFFKKMIIPLIFLVRLIIIGLITFDFFEHFSSDIPYGLQFEGLRASLILFYVPLSLLLLVFTWFIHKKVFWITLIVDILVIYFFDDLLKLYV